MAHTPPVPPTPADLTHPTSSSFTHKNRWWRSTGAKVTAVTASIFVAIAVIGNANSNSNGTSSGLFPQTSTVSTPQTTLAGAPTPTLQTVSPLTGHWVGAVTGAQSGYDVDVVLNDTESSLSGTVTYPQLSCGGTWTEVGRRGDRVELLEVITYGACVEEVDVVLIPNADGTLHFEGHWDASSEPIVSTMTRHE